MKTTSTAPSWAVELVETVCQEYKRRLPRKFSWYNTSKESSSGFTHYDGSQLHVSAGTDKSEARVILLHELAHHVLAKTEKGRRGHNKAFWHMFITLSHKYGDIHLSYQREIVQAREWRGGRLKGVEAFQRMADITTELT